MVSKNEKNYTLCFCSFILVFSLQAQDNKVVYSKKDSLKIISWNIFQLPKIATFGKNVGNTSYKKRIDLVINYLKKGNFDLIILEEAYNNFTLKKLMLDSKMIMYLFQKK